MPAEDARPPRRPFASVKLPPCRDSFMIHYRDDEPYGLVIDGKAYRVKPLKGRGTGFRQGDYVVVVVQGSTID